MLRLRSDEHDSVFRTLVLGVLATAPKENAKRDGVTKNIHIFPKEICVDIALKWKQHKPFRRNEGKKLDTDKRRADTL